MKAKTKYDKFGDRPLDEDDYIFDGFCHRRFDPDMDGWRNAMSKPHHYPAVVNAYETLKLFEDLQEAQLRIWELEREIERMKPLYDSAVQDSMEFPGKMFALICAIGTREAKAFEAGVRSASGSDDPGEEPSSPKGGTTAKNAFRARLPKGGD